MSWKDTGWGAENIIINTAIEADQGGDLVLKKIKLDTEEMTPLERHRHANTIIYVETGAIELTVGDDFFELEEGEGHYIEAGEKHRIENLVGSVAEVLRISFPFDPDDIDVLDNPYS
ncbi:MAG: cupin domain-containing protein [Candidatus Nanohaloarchaea archaeon]|nr:cupin domain-containing protein [Candidatus Nanohaloarchaea archaeon]